MAIVVYFTFVSFTSCIIRNILDPIADFCGERGLRKSSKKKKVVLRIPSNISKEVIAKNFESILLILNSSPRKNVKVQKKLGFNKLCEGYTKYQKSIGILKSKLYK
jgi:hypothetical protein